MSTTTNNIILDRVKDTNINTDKIKERIQEIDEEIIRLRQVKKECMKSEKSTIRSLYENLQNEKLALKNTRGREIDLKELLGMKDSKGNPMWCFLNPLHKPSTRNGYIEKYVYSFEYNIRLNKINFLIRNSIINVGTTSKNNISNILPSNVPLLPPKIRKLIRNKEIIRNSHYIGLLYQPNGWLEVNPDPAIIVRWNGSQKFHLLAVWGHDGPQIEEFI